MIAHAPRATAARPIRLEAHAREGAAGLPGASERDVRPQQGRLNSMARSRRGTGDASKPALDEIELKPGFCDPEVLEADAQRQCVGTKPEVIAREPSIRFEIRFLR